MRKDHITASVTLLALLCSPLIGATVTWIPGQSPPVAWGISPANPGPTDVIAYSGPLDVSSYSNSCIAEMNLGGTAKITVDSLNKIVDIWFQGPAPAACPVNFQPVCGLEGTFGPLTAGKWTLRCQILGITVQFIISEVAGVIYVDQDATGFPVNGTSWKQAYRNLQDALAVAGPGAEIRIANGTYKPDVGASQIIGDRAASFVLPNDVLVRGGYAGDGALDPDARDTNVYETILDGDLNDDDQWGILNRNDNSYHVVRIFGAAKVEGVTIINGQADGAFGGGLYIESGDVVLAHCTLRENTAVFGGGIACLGSSLYIANSKISGNRAYFLGGGLYSHDSSTSVVSSLLTGNSAGGNGSGGGSAVCNIGGEPAQVRLSNCTLADNIGPGPDDRVLYNFTYFNGQPLIPTTLFVQNCIVYNEGGDSLIWTPDPATVGVSYSIIQGSWSGSNNLDSDPMFVERGLFSVEGQWEDASSDYRLSSGSPGIDHGSNSLIPDDEADVDDDGDLAETHPWDLASQSRVQDGQVDAGAYEQPPGNPGPGPAWQFLTATDVTIDVPYGVNAPITLSGGPFVFEIESNVQVELLLEVEAVPLTGGTWTAWFDPDPGYIGPGSVNVYWRIKGENVAVNLLTPGATDVKVAQVNLYVRPAP